MASSVEETVFTTAEGIQVTSPAGAFDTPTLVRVIKKDRATLGIPIPAGMELGAYVDVDFAGTAKETLRLKISVTTSAAVGTLVFVTERTDLPWGARLKMMDLAKIIDGGNGTKLLSNADADQPPLPTNVRRSLADSTSTERMRFLKTTLLQLTMRTTAALLYSAGNSMSAMFGQTSLNDTQAASSVLYDAQNDSFVYVPLPQNWSGSFILPVLLNSAPNVVQRDLATGWILGQKTYDPITGAGALIKVAEFPPQGALKRPTLISLSPFDVIRFRADETSGADACQRLRLEIEACVSSSGRLTVKPISLFPLPARTNVELYKLGPNLKDIKRGSVEGGAFPELTVDATPDDELVLVVSASDIASESLSSFSMSFAEPVTIKQENLDCATDATCLVTLTDLGSKDGATTSLKIPVSIKQDGSSTLRIEPAGTLPLGHRFNLKIRDVGLISAKNAKGDILFYPTFAPKDFSFETRAAIDKEIGSVGVEGLNCPPEGGAGCSLGDTNTARDMLKLGNLLLVASGTGNLLAIDISNIARVPASAGGLPRPFAVMNHTADQVRALATDGHNRIFYSQLFGSGWSVKAVRLEDVRSAAQSKCPLPSPTDPQWKQGLACFDPLRGGVRTAISIGTQGLLASEYNSVSSVLPAGQPTAMELLVSDETNPPKSGVAGPTDKTPKYLDLVEFSARYGASALPTPDADGFYHLNLKLQSTHKRKGDLKFRDDSSVCSPEEQQWDHYQRVTVDDLTTGQSWSFDIQNDWPALPPDTGVMYGSSGGELAIPATAGVRARAGDRMRVRFNLRSFGYLAIVGSGITVLDLNRFYNTLTPAAAFGASRGSDCGRRLERLEGESWKFPECPSGNPSTALSYGLALTPALAVLSGAGETFSQSVDGSAAIYSPLIHFGVVHSSHLFGSRALPQIPGVPKSPNSFVDESACLTPRRESLPAGVGVSLRDITIARGPTWLDRGIVGDQELKFTVRDSTKNRTPVTVSATNANGTDTIAGSDLGFVSLGAAGVAIFDLRERRLGSPAQLIGRFFKKDHLVYKVAVDQSGRYLFAGGTNVEKSPTEPFIDVWDIARANGGPDQGTGIDPRLLSTIKAPWDANHIAFDESGTGLLFTWGNDSKGGRALPVTDPKFVFAGLYRPDKDPTSGGVLPVSRVTARFAPLGIPLRIASKDENDPDKKKEAERVGTAAFRLRVALPGDLGPTLIAKVQSLRALPEERLLAKEDVGPTIAMPGGPGWPKNEVFVTLHRVGKAYSSDANDLPGESGRLSLAFNEYESKEIVILLADPRARAKYWEKRQKVEGDLNVSQLDEDSQCRRCERPEYIQALIDAGTLDKDKDIKELLAGGPYLRVFLSTTSNDPEDTDNQPPTEGKTDTQTAIKFFKDLNTDRDVYRAPAGVATLMGYSDEIPSPLQVSLAEPIQNPAMWDVGEAGAAVSLVSGEAILGTTDHFVKGRGLDVALSRSYRSGFLGYTAFGSAGWNTPLFAHIREIPAIEKARPPDDPNAKPELLYPGELQYHDGQGHVLKFYPPCQEKPDAPCPAGYVSAPVTAVPTTKKCPEGYENDDAGSYCMPNGLYLRVEKLAKGWRIVGREHDSAVFDEKGRLTELADRFRRDPKDDKERGNELHLSYDGFGQLAHLRDDYGRSYRLSYRDDPRPVPNGAGRKYGLIEKLEDFADRNVKYEFDDDRRLTRVKLPEVKNQGEYSSYSFTGDQRPTLEYVYSTQERAGSAPLNGKEFSKLALVGLKLPKYLSGDAPERVHFNYDLTTGRVAAVVLPTGDEATVNTLTWGVKYTPPGEVKPPTLVELTAPWGHTTNYTLNQFGRPKTIEDKESLDFFSPPTDEDALPPKTPTVTSGTAKTGFEYWDDGRTRKIVQPDKGFTEFFYRKADESDGKDRQSRGDPKARIRNFGDGDKGGILTYSTQPASVDTLTDNIPSTLNVAFDSDGSQRLVATGVPVEKKDDGKPPASAFSGFPQGIVTKEIKHDAMGRITALDVGPKSTAVIKLQPIYGKFPTSQDEAGFLTKIQLATTGTSNETYTYDNDLGTKRGNVTRVTTSFGAISERTFDEWDRVIQEVSGKSSGDYREVGAVAEVAFDAAGHVTRERRNQGRLGFVTSTHVYNAREQLVATTLDKAASAVAEAGDPSRTLTVARYAYAETTGLLKSVTTGTADGEAGVTTEYFYDAAGRLSYTHEKGASDTTGDRRVAYDIAGHVVYQNDGDEGATWTKFDSLGRPYLEVLPTGARIARVFDQGDRVVNEKVTAKQPDPADPTKTVTATLAETTSTYEPYGLVKRVEKLLDDTAVAGGSREVTFVYDSVGRVTNVDGKDSNVASTERHLKEVKFKTDGTGRIESEKDAFGNEITYLIPANAPWVKSATFKEAGTSISTTTTIDRDVLGRVIGETLGNGTRIDRTLDEAGNLLSLLRAGGNEVASQFDSRGFVTSVTSVMRGSTGQRTLFGYDGGGRNTQRRVEGRTGGPDITNFGYDTIGRLKRRTRPGSAEEQFDYNPDGTIQKWTTRLKGTGGVQIPIVYEYDSANNLKSRKVDPTFTAIPSGLSKLDSGDAFSYDALSRLVSASIKSGTGATEILAGAKVSFGQYDRRGLPKTETVGGWGEPLTRTYDIWGNATQLSYPGLARSSTISGVGKSFDALDRPIGVFLTDAGQQPVTALGADFTWGGLGRLLSTKTRGTTSTPGLEHRMSYLSPGSRLDELSFKASGRDLGKLGYTWDAPKDEKSVRSAGGAPAGQLDALQGAGWNFSHDAAQRLTGAKSGSGTGNWSYTFGAADELKQIDDLGAATSEKATSSVEGRLATRGAVSYRYDDEARRIGDDRAGYTWDWRGRLVQADFKANSPVDPAERLLYTHDALGRLLSRERRGKLPENITDDNQRPFMEKRIYTWDGQSLLSETGVNYADQPIWRKQYIPGPGGLDDAVQVHVENDLTGVNGAPTSANFVFLRDEMGTVVGVAADKLRNGKPALLARYLYTPFGEAHIESGPEPRRNYFDPNLKVVNGQTQALAVAGESFAGTILAETTIALDAASLADGLILEEKTSEGWTAVARADFAIAINTTDTPSLQIMRLAGWPKSSAYRVHLTRLLLDGFGRALQIPEAGQTEVVFGIDIPADGRTAPFYEKKYEFKYDSVLAASDTLGGAMPGGQNLLFQGLWQDPATGWAYARARWLDTRSGTFTAEDPLGAVDSVNLSAFVGLRPAEGRDPSGLLSQSQMNLVTKLVNSSKGFKGMYAERALERMLASNGRVILEGPLTSGKGVFERGADVIAYNKATKKVEFWDSKYLVNDKSVSRVSTLTSGERMQANRTRARELVEGSGMEAEAEMLAALDREGGIHRFVGKAGLGNNVRGITKRVEDTGVIFGDAEVIRTTGRSEAAVAREARRLAAKRVMKGIAIAGLAAAVTMDANELHAAEGQDDAFGAMVSDYRGMGGQVEVSWLATHGSLFEAAMGVAGEEGGTYLGAALGGASAGLLGLPSGPGAFVTGAAGAIGGGMGGGRLGRWIGTTAAHWIAP
ncbi:MAG: RHS repeat-associated core domain-containing protein [Thermoanaerobaculia bacterium]